MSFLNTVFMVWITAFIAGSDPLGYSSYLSKPQTRNDLVFCIGESNQRHCMCVLGGGGGGGAAESSELCTLLLSLGGVPTQAHKHVTNTHARTHKHTHVCI